ncbi:MAG TPA: CotH kinase family protein, partial [Flavobacteriales bacterium]|nr:CotH kinase family protein [Flavobacteriales bacterium]
MPRIEPSNALLHPDDSITIAATQGEQLWLSTCNDVAKARPVSAEVNLPAAPDRRAIARALATPTAIQWRHPKPGLPEALVVRAAQGDGARLHGPYAMRTYLFARHELPIVSISLASDDWLGADRGIAVPGNGALRAAHAVARSYAIDPKWWKYPGNYHGRGKAWERSARMQLIAADGEEMLQAGLSVRINGQMTRGFPQHALRLMFDEPLAAGPFVTGDGAGSRALVLRAAGNDQVKAMMRDAFQHRLCEGLPFGTSKALTCATYINGAYQGVYHLRQRLDEHEMARRLGVSAKRITIIEDKNVLYRGDTADVLRFSRLMGATERWDARDPAWLNTLESRLDVDGFLSYMASQMILGNMDWPRQNVKYWRYTGEPQAAPL